MGIAIPAERRKPKKKALIKVKGATGNNLKNVSADDAAGRVHVH
jgi:excinuclease ABC subunit A